MVLRDAFVASCGIINAVAKGTPMLGQVLMQRGGKSKSAVVDNWLIG
jgi:hypothetical protein